MHNTTQIRIDRGNRERGSILILGALTMLVVLAFTGLALDTSYMFFQKRTMQTAADAGAYGGALELLRGDSAGVTAAAKHDTALNGYTDGSDDVTVTVHNPPQSGSKSGDSKFVEVIVERPQPTWFMRVLSFNSITIDARAVAGLGTTGNGCVYALNQNTGNNDGFFVNGTTNSSFSCGVFSNSNFRSVGGACVVTPTVSYAGTYSNSSDGTDCGPAGVTQGVPVADPMLNKYSIPSYLLCDFNNYKETSLSTVVMVPGTYCGGISIGGSVQTVTFLPGVYILVGGGLSINGSANVSGTGVTFFNTYDQSNQYGAISINGSGTVTLSAPTSGPYEALLFYQDPTVAWSSSNGSIIAGGSTSVYDGIIYFPTTDLEYAGNSSSTAGGTDRSTMIVGYNVTIRGTSQINTDFSSLSGGVSPLENAVFAE
ncbi:MAG TPA: pilus assembly protein TadG-related protein [Bryobacteraceae bacterium]|nr:pilus assembly protein TadG-related protein [Bryobacteraceae bacterium]